MSVSTPLIAHALLNCIVRQTDIVISYFTLRLHVYSLLFLVLLVVMCEGTRFPIHETVVYNKVVLDW